MRIFKPGHLAEPKTRHSKGFLPSNVKNPKACKAATQGVLSTYLDNMVCVVGITIVIWGSIPQQVPGIL